MLMTRESGQRAVEGMPMTTQQDGADAANGDDDRDSEGVDRRQGRGKQSTASWQGETLTVAGWADRFGVDRTSLLKQIQRRGFDIAMRLASTRGLKVEAGAAVLGSRTRSESDAMDLKMAASSVANAHRLVIAGDEVEGLAQAAHAYRSLGDLLRRRRCKGVELHHLVMR